MGSAALGGKPVAHHNVEGYRAHSVEIERRKVNLVLPLPKRRAAFRERRHRPQFLPWLAIPRIAERRSIDADVVARREHNRKLRVRREAKRLHSRLFDDHSRCRVEEALDEPAAPWRGKTLRAYEVKRPVCHKVRNHFMAICRAAVHEQLGIHRTVPDVKRERYARSIDRLKRRDLVVRDDAWQKTGVVRIVDPRRERLVLRHFADTHRIIAGDCWPRAHAVPPFGLCEIGRRLVDSAGHWLNVFFAPAQRALARNADARRIGKTLGDRRLDAHDHSSENGNVARLHGDVA